MGLKHVTAVKYIAPLVMLFCRNVIDDVRIFAGPEIILIRCSKGEGEFCTF